MTPPKKYINNPTGGFLCAGIPKRFKPIQLGCPFLVSPQAVHSTPGLVVVPYLTDRKSRSLFKGWGHYFDGFWGLSKSVTGLFPFNPPLNGGDFDHGKIMRPERLRACRSGISPATSCERAKDAQQQKLQTSKRSGERPKGPSAISEKSSALGSKLFVCFFFLLALFFC